MMVFLAAKKKLKRKALVNMGRRFKESVCQIPVVETHMRKTGIRLEKL